MRRVKAWLALGCALLAGCGARSSLYAPDVGGGGSGGSSGLAGSGGTGGAPRTGTPVSCDQDAGLTSVFVVTAASNLYSFDPPSGAFTFVASLSCPSSSSPETMAVDREGTAYVTYGDGTMFAVDLASQSCAATPFSDGTNCDRFGSCFAANAGGQGETFFLMDGNAELTGTGDGRLFAFGAPAGSCQGSLAQLDPATAAVIDQMPVPILADNAGFAFASWAGDFYFFVADTCSNSTVGRLVPGGAFHKNYALLAGEVIVGAGVSTCAPVK
jgi:hypothetical protein